jgi:hypothetical protein
MAAVTCPEMRELFSARVDDALTTEERARLDAHLATCAECAAEWQRFERTVGLLRAVAPAQAPTGFVDRVLAARPRPWYRRLAQRLFVPWPVKLPLEAAAIVLVAGLAIIIFQRSPELQQAARAPEPPAAVPSPPAAVPTPGRQEPEAEGMTAPRRTGELSDKSTPHGAGSPTAERRADSTAPRVPAPTTTAPAAPPTAESPRLAPESASKSAGTGDLRALKEADQEGGRAAARQAAPSTSGDLQTLTARVPVLGRLRVADRAAAERRAAELVTRAGGQVLSRHEEPGALVLGLVVPHDRWDEVRRELGTLGPLRLEGDPARAAGPARVTLRLED